MKTLLTCAEIFMAVSSHRFSVPDQIIEMPLGAFYELRVATVEDIPDTTHLIRRSYSYWVENGIDVAPAHQTQDKTMSHLLERGFVITDVQKRIIGTFSLDVIRLRKTGGNIEAQFESGSKVEYESKTHEAVGGRFLEFKKLAIARDLSKTGIGRRLYDLAEEYARSQDFDGIVLETVIEARWLFDWYISMGYEAVGGLVYSGSKMETLLLMKRF